MSFKIVLSFIIPELQSQHEKRCVTINGIFLQNYLVSVTCRLSALSNSSVVVFFS